MTFNELIAKEINSGKTSDEIVDVVVNDVEFLNEYYKWIAYQMTLMLELPNISDENAKIINVYRRIAKRVLDRKSYLLRKTRLKRFLIKEMPFILSILITIIFMMLERKG